MNLRRRGNGATATGLGGAARERARMRLFRRARQWVRVLAISAVAVGSTMMFGTSFLHVYRLEREAARLVRLRENLQQQNAILREEITLLHSPAYIEKIAREQLGLVKPGEITLLIVQPPPAPPTASLKPAPRPSWAARTLRRFISIFHR